MQKLIHYVDAQGRVHKVTQQTEEQQGRLDVRFADGRVETVRSLDVANSQHMANVMAVNRRPSGPQKIRIESPQILRNPK